MRKYDIAVAWGNARLRALADLGVPIKLPESRWIATHELAWQTNLNDPKVRYLELRLSCLWCIPLNPAYQYFGLKNRGRNRFRPHIVAREEEAIWSLVSGWEKYSHVQQCRHEIYARYKAALQDDKFQTLLSLNIAFQ